MKKIFFVLIFFVLLPCKSVFSAEAAYDENVYQEQYDSSGAKELFDELPSEVKKSFDNIGVNGADFNKIMDINPESVIENILDTAKKKASRAVKVGKYDFGSNSFKCNFYCA